MSVNIPLPPSNDEYWLDAQQMQSKPQPIILCSNHTKDSWMKGTYIQNSDGSISCTLCSWGSRIPGYMRVIDGKIKDLRSA